MSETDELRDSITETRHVLKGLRRLASQALQLTADTERRLNTYEASLADRRAQGGIPDDHEEHDRTASLAVAR